MIELINRNKVFIKYIISAGISFTLDILLFTIFNLLLKNFTSFSIIISTIGARVISSFINYSINKNKVFNFNGERNSILLIKYFTLVVIQMFVSSFSVLYLYKLSSINETIIKIFVDIILFIINFFVQKKLIFVKEDSVVNTNRGNLYLFIVSLISTLSFVVNPIESNSAIKFVFPENLILNSCILLFVFCYYKKYYNLTIRKKSFKFISLLFSLFLIFGYSFHNIDSSYLVFGNYQYIILACIKLIGYFVFFNLSLNLLYDFLNNLKFTKEYTNKFIVYFKKHPMKVSVVVLFFSYLIYLIAYFPGVVGYDPSYQIKEIMGIPNFYADSVIIISDKTTLTAFNPVFHTLLIGGLFKLGLFFGSANIGIFFYTSIQFIIMILILSYSIKFLSDEKVSTTALLIVLGIYAFVPVFPYYAICAFKDTYFALMFLLFVIQLYKSIKYSMDLKRVISLALIAFCLCLFRKNGMITVSITLISFVCCLKGKRKLILMSFAIFFLLYTGYNKIIDYCGVTPTSPREMLSVPFQQTAALVVNKEEIISEEDKLIIGKILDYDKIKENYNPELSDPIKNTYNKYATEDDLREYFGVWFKYLIKEPKIYVEATINNIYGYFYPEDHIWYFYHKKYNTLNEAGFDYQYNNLSWLRAILYGYGTAFSYIPLIGLLVNIGFTIWIYIYMIGYLIENKNKKALLLLIPAFTILLACIVGPVNTYYRYILPCSMSLPILLMLLCNNRKRMNLD